MITSRRPNRRASTENAPGPSRTTATNITDAKAMDRFVSSKPCLQPASSAARMAATGVRRPMVNKAPRAMAGQPHKGDTRKQKVP
jgi:hypothetical protein